MKTSPPRSPDDALASAISQGMRSLAEDPKLAGEIGRRILSVAPHRLDAQLLLGAALRRANALDEALAVLEPAARSAGKAWGPFYELGATYAALGRADEAAEMLRRAVDLNPKAALAWHALGDQLAVLGRLNDAEAAHAYGGPGSPSDPALVEGALALFAGDRAKADQILKNRFSLHPTDPAAVRLIADAALRQGRYDAAESLLASLVRSSPRFVPARSAYAVVLLIQNEALAALAEAEYLLSIQDDNAYFFSLRGAARMQIGDYDLAVEDFTRSLSLDPLQTRVWLSHGHALRTLGRREESVVAYRRSLDLAPTLGEAYWSLANLKVVRFDLADREAMIHALKISDLGADDRAHLHFALGKSLEDEGGYEAAFEHYARGNAIRRRQRPYDWRGNRAYVKRSRETFTAPFFAERSRCGFPAEDPIFVLGLPRSGSTLIEQILSSHSAVEGASELPDLIRIASRIAGKHKRPAGSSPTADAYPEVLRNLDPSMFYTLGLEFIENTKIRRKTNRPFFVDKSPGNFMHIGLIHLILPNSKIIDARRSPMACCFSIFKQNFAKGADYSYDLGDLGRYYVDYLDLMDHFDSALPGRVHRVLYEDMVSEPEREVTRLLAYCGLDFEPACLSYYDNDRPVRTASSEQVRLPLYREGLDQWRRFEPWLNDLRTELPAEAAF